MKTIKNCVKFLTIALIAGMLTSCNDEFQSIEQENDQFVTALQENDLSGESLPEIKLDEFNVSPKEDYMNKFKTKRKNPKDVTEIEPDRDFLRDNNISNISCGTSFVSSTVGQSSTLDHYGNKPDQIYKLTLNKKTRVNSKLHQMTKDLDLFLYGSFKFWGIDWIGSKIESNIQFGLTEEQFDVILEPGVYFIVVESYASPGNFRLSTQCAEIVPITYCRDHESLTPSYTNGVSNQSNRWCKWPGANDGKVLNYSQWDGNNVVKFDASRFNYQDAVRHFANTSLSGGVYSMSWKMYVPFGKRADFVTEKTQIAGQEQGMYVKMKNGDLLVKHAGTTVNLWANYPQETWIKVRMVVDMDNKVIHTRIGNAAYIKTKTRATVNQLINGRNQIFGVDFFTKEYHSKFHIDDVCVTQGLEGGISGPLLALGAAQIVDFTAP